MASKTIVRVIDDLDGSTDASTVPFAFDGVQYAIDLSPKNRAAFEKALKPYLSAATRVARSGRGQGRRASGSRNDLSAVRAWAKKNGYSVSDRGRVPREVLDAYDAAD